jgi:hypothetical protein
VVDGSQELRLTLEARHAVRIGRKGGRQNFQRDVAVESRIARPADLAHPACPERAGDLVRADSRAWSQCHGRADYARQSAFTGLG